MVPDSSTDQAAVPLSMPPDAAKRATRNITALAASNLSTKGLLFLWQLILARWLGDAGYGTYGTIGALMAIGATIPEFGMGMIVIRDVATRRKDAGRYLAATLVMQPALAVVAYVSLMVTSLLLGYGAELRALLALTAVNLLVDALGNMGHNQLLAIEQMVIPAIISTGHILLLVGLAGAALAAGGGLWGMYIAMLAAGIVRALAYWIALWRAAMWPTFPFDREIARSLIINGAPLAVTSFLALAYTHSDKLITTALIGTKDTGQLTAGFVIVFGVIEMLSTTVLVAVFPLMSRVHSIGMRDMFDFMLEKLAFFNLTLSLPIAVFTSLLAVPLSALIFGPEFTRTAGVLQILIWYTVVAMVTNVFARALLIENRQKLLLQIRTGGLGLNVLLNIILLPRIGIRGAPIATLCSEVSALVLILYVLKLPVSWWQRMLDHLWRLGIVALILIGLVALLREAHPLAAALIGLPAYAAMVLLSGAFARDDWDLIYRLAMAMPGGAIIGRYWKRQLV